MGGMRQGKEKRHKDRNDGFETKINQSAFDGDSTVGDEVIEDLFKLVSDSLREFSLGSKFLKNSWVFGSHVIQEHSFEPSNISSVHLVQVSIHT